ncbi:MAG: hypothetical protein M9887_10260 [Chitinophagales bacterium]|nr:hypothetical protein [Chitinophagales bacterium]
MNIEKSKLPDAFIRNMKDILGWESEKLFESFQSEETSSIRLHPNKEFSPDFTSTDITWESKGRYLQERPIFALDPAWHAGAYYVQESSSMLVTQALEKINLSTPIRVLDLCAAPGGKSTHLLSLISEDSLLISNEIIPKRNQILVENLEKWGSNNIIITKAETYQFGNLESFFDIILVDAPCSGEGLFRKDKKAIDEWKEDNVQMCTDRQEDILRNIAPALKKEGYLIYSTCTYEVKENEEQIQKLIDTGEFELIPLDSTELPGVEDGKIKGTLRCWTHQVKGSGFFIALLKKVKEHTSGEALVKERHWNWQVIKKTEKIINEFANFDEKNILFQSGEFIRLFPKNYQFDLNLIGKRIPVTHFGINIGQLKKNILIPAQGLVHSKFLHNDIQKYEIRDREMALDYLRRKDIPTVNYLSNGWAVAQYKNLHLGWIKKNSQRINNYYPISWMLKL